MWPVFRVLAVASTEFALSGALIERSPARLRKYNHCGGTLKNRRQRRAAGNCQNPQPSGPADPRPAALPRAASRFIPNDLRAENRLPTQADGAARSECERAARSGTLRAPPTAAPPKPAEATSGFSSNRKTIDNSPVRRYCSGQKKGGLKFLYRSRITPISCHRTIPSTWR